MADVKMETEVMENIETNISHKLANENVLEFLFGGNALFTVKNNETGKHMSFKVIKSKKTQKNIYYVMKNDGQIFLGTIFDRNKFVFSKKSSVAIDSPEVKAFVFVFDRLLKNNLPAKVEIWHNGKCGRCGRTLTEPSSILVGYGPECFRISKKIKSIKTENWKDPFLD